MAEEDCEFLFGSSGDSSGGSPVIKRLHLATRGVGDAAALARTLDEYRYTRRYVAEGTKLIVNKKAGSSIALSEPSRDQHSDQKDYQEKNEAAEITHAHTKGAETMALDAAESTNVARVPVFHKVADFIWESEDNNCTSATGSSQRRIKRTKAEVKSSSAATEEPMSFSTSFIRACTATLDMTLSLANTYVPSDANETLEYIVIKCEPAAGYIGDSTVFYADDNLPKLRRLELLWDVENESHVNRCVEHFLSSEYVGSVTRDIRKYPHQSGPYRITNENSNEEPQSGRVKGNMFLNLKRQATEISQPSETRGITNTSTMIDLLLKNMFNSVLLTELSSEFRVFYPGQSLLVRDLKLFISSTLPPNKPGIITAETEVYLGIDTVGECQSVSVAPLRDTLPTTYEYNLLKDCVEPYFRGNSSRIFRVDDVFMFGGVQFRVISFEKRSEPLQLFHMDISLPFRRHESCSRVGPNSEIHVRDPVDPQLTDLLTAEQMSHIRRCAPNQRETLMLSFASQLDLEVMSRLCVGEPKFISGMAINNIEYCSESARLSSSDFIADTVEHYNITDSSPASENLEPESGDVICTVCCEPVNPETNANLFRYKCGHLFHGHCAKSCMKICGNSCPNCRYRGLESTATGTAPYSHSFHTLSDNDDTDTSNYYYDGKSPGTASADSDSELLRWFNSQDME